MEGGGGSGAEEASKDEESGGQNSNKRQGTEGQEAEVGGRPRGQSSSEGSSSSEQFLTIVYFNARSIFNKIDDLQLSVFVNKPDIIIITETWCNDDISNSMLQIQGYSLESELRRDRKDTANGIGGGILVYCRENIIVKNTTLNHEFNQFVCFEVMNGGRKTSGLNFCVIYRSPNSNTANNELLLDLIEKLPKKYCHFGGF